MQQFRENQWGVPPHDWTDAGDLWGLTDGRHTQGFPVYPLGGWLQPPRVALDDGAVADGWNYPLGDWDALPVSFPPWDGYLSGGPRLVLPPGTSLSLDDTKQLAAGLTDDDDWSVARAALLERSHALL